MDDRALCGQGVGQMSTVPVIDIGNGDVLSRQAPVRRLVYLVLLLAVKDRAAEVRFEPSEADREWKLRYEVGGQWHDMEPVPLDVPICQEIRRLGGMRSASRWRRLLAWPGDTGVADERTIRLVISGKAVELTASLHRSGHGNRQLETAVLRLPRSTGPADDAGRVLGEYLENWRRQEASAGGLAGPGTEADPPGD
jgi:hypothetical protein